MRQAAECPLAQAEDLDNARRDMSQIFGSRPRHAAHGASLAKATSRVTPGRSWAQAAGSAFFLCLTVGSLAFAACSSDEKPPRSASYRDDTTTAPATPFRDLPGDGNEVPAPPAAPPRDRPTPNSDDVQAGPEGIFGGSSNATGDAGASESADAGADTGADAASN
jgi:hypothetical protein